VPRRLSAGQLRRVRLRAQLLAGTGASDPAGAVSRVVGVQAQAAPPARLAVRARTDGSTADDVDAATRSRGPTLVRGWVMRGTLHMVAADDLGWLVALFGPQTIRSDARRRAELGLSDRLCERVLDILPAVLTEPMTRAALIERLGDAGIPVTPGGQAPAHLLMFAACAGVICRGPDLDRDEPTYVPVDSWLPARARRTTKDRDDALRELAARYLSGYGPATVDDFAAWSGLPKRDARAGVESLGSDAEVVSTELGDMLAIVASLEPADAAARVRLLGAFDTLLLGYRSRDLLLDPRHAKQVQAGGGMIAATVLVDGRIVGTWKLDRGARRNSITVSPFDTLPRGSAAGIEAEVADVGRFLGMETALRINPSATGRPG
jgi:Winged helix DNA-binding domain